MPSPEAENWLLLTHQLPSKPAYLQTVWGVGYRFGET